MVLFLKFAETDKSFAILNSHVIGCNFVGHARFYLDIDLCYMKSSGALKKLFLFGNSYPVV